MYHDKTAHAAKGKWRGILKHFGVPDQFLQNKHGPCPLCEGETRYRFDDKDGEGTWICNHCGAGNGFSLLTKFTGRQFADLASEIDQILGNITPDTAPKQPDIDRQALLRAAWLDSKPVTEGDLAHAYLTSRGIGERVYPRALRFAPAMRDGDGGVRPCMLAMVGLPGAAKFDTVHRTFLRADGMAKAEMESPRKLMPGPVPDGACIALCEGQPSVLGVAEGIETALSASALFDIPVWSLIDAGKMAKWVVPDWVEELVIFGDNDPKFAGQAGAYALARRASVKNKETGVERKVSVHIPDVVGTDWADVYTVKRRCNAAASP